MKRILLVSPDYVSHFYALSAIGEVLAQRGVHVTVATGPGLEERVRALGFDYRRLVLGPGSNTGVLRPEEQPGAEGEHMRAFFDATRRGLAATLRYQSESRQHDMLWEPEAVFRRLGEIVSELTPDLVLVDQLSYGATLALHALGVPFASFHPGNPSSLPGPDQLFGYPARVPEAIPTTPIDLASLRALCVRTTERFTERFNEVLADLAPEAAPVRNAFAFTSPLLTLVNYPAVLAEGPQGSSPSVRFLGSCVRNETHDEAFDRAVGDLPSGRRTAYVSLGSFLSAREDVLATIVAGLKRLPVNVILASGMADIDLWQPLPEGWIVRSVVPQPAALQVSDLVVTHGGNNTVTEALTAGLPMLVLPFSSDQFDGAADIEGAGLGEVLDPNSCGPEEIRMMVHRLLWDDVRRDRAAAIGRDLRAHPGPELAADLLEIAAHAGGVPVPS